MIRVNTLMKLSGAHWVLPLQFLTAWIYLSGTFSIAEGYAPSDQAVATESLILGIPFVALAGAVLANKLERSTFLDRPTKRPAVLTVGLPLLTIIIPSSALALSTQLYSVINADAPIFTAGFAVIAVAWIVVATLFGWLVGAKLPLKLAAPISVLVPYVVLGFPPAFDPPWFQHMMGMSTGCCDVYEDLSWRPVAATTSTTAGIALALWVTVSKRGSRPLLASVIAGVLVPIFLIGAAVTIARPLSYDATAPRNASELTCRDIGTEVCYWPEHAAEIENAEIELRALVLSAQKHGLHVPDQLLEIPPTQAAWPDAPISFLEGDSPSVIQWKVASAFMPLPTPECQEKMARTDVGDSMATYALGAEVMMLWLTESVQNPAPNDQVSSGALEAADSLKTDSDGGAERLLAAQNLITDCSFGKKVL